MPKKLPPRIKEQVRERARGYCEYCLSPEAFSTYDFSCDHITPAIRGGSDKLENLALACQGCNGSKYDRTEAEDPVSGEMVPLYNPRKQKWNEHFSWSDDFTEIIGLTPTGRATVEMLKLNRLKLKNLRQGLFKLKHHPPVHLFE